MQPNSAHNTISGVEIKSCRILRNAGAGVQFALHAYTAQTKPVGVCFNDSLIVGPLSVCLPSTPGCYTNKPYRRWGILFEAHTAVLPSGHVQFSKTTVVDSIGWNSPPVWVEKPWHQAPLSVGFNGLTVNMSNGGPAMAISAIFPVSGGVSVSGAVINRECCPAGENFLFACNNGQNQLVDVTVQGVRVYVNASDTESQAATECNATLSANATSNNVTLSPVLCIKA